MKVKLIVTGPFSSGKTEFISRISEIDPITTEKRMTNPDEISKGGKEFTTVAMDFGRITVDEEL
ncbi:MAG TPA: GTP-binding protein, partial [Euryarchaeota archaeon]|nr:GTP-binding protein [Euryarchaeota archaeon]